MNTEEKIVVFFGSLAVAVTIGAGVVGLVCLLGYALKNWGPLAVIGGVAFAYLWSICYALMRFK